MALEPPSGFEYATSGLGIQHLNKWVIAPYILALSQRAWGINSSLKNTPSPLSCQDPLKSANSPRPPFLGNPPYILFFWNLYSPKYQIFPWTSTISIFFILNPILTFKNCEILTRNFPVLIHSYDREKHFCLHTFFVIKGFRLFLM